MEQASNIPAASASSEPRLKARRIKTENIHALILLGGSVRANRMSESIKRSLLDLPVATGTSLMQRWHGQASALAAHLELRRLEVRVIIDRDSKDPAIPLAHQHVILSVEKDPIAFRGTGGVLRDLSVGYADDEYVLVTSAAQLLWQDLGQLVEKLAERGGDVGLTSHLDGSISSLMLVRCGVLRQIAATGFVDMKEQALPQIARSHRVEIVRINEVGASPIRTRADYLAALRRYHRRLKGLPDSHDPFEEDWTPTFSVVEDGATVAPGATIHDSVVLAGARVEAAAVVVRSLICPQAVVRRGEMIVEELGEAGRPYRSGR